MASTTEVALNFATLMKLDEGKINKLMMLMLQRLAQDCLNRPQAGKRKVILEFEGDAICNEFGDCEEVQLTIGARTKIPDYKSKPYLMRVNPKGLTFEVPDDALVSEAGKDDE